MRKTAAAIFIGLICIITQGCSGARHEPPPYQSKMVHDKGGSTLYTVDPGTLIPKFWASNEVALRQYYIGKRVAVESPIRRVESLSNGDPALYFVWLDTSVVVCEFSKMFINDIAKMSGGQNVIVIGTVSDFSHNYNSRSNELHTTVYLKDCIFAQPAPQTGKSGKESIK